MNKSMVKNLLITKTTSELRIYYIFSVAFDNLIQAVKITKLKLCFDAMVLLAWWSAPEVKLGNKMSTTKWLDLNHQMLQDLK